MPIRIHIIASEYYFWNSVSSLCKSFEQDPLFDLTVVYPDEANYEDRHDIWTYSTTSVKEYDLNNLPDVLIFSNPYDRIEKLEKNAKYIRENVKIILAIPFIVIRYHGNNEYFWKILEDSTEIYKPDFYLFDALVYNGIKDEYWCDDRFVCMGNPKYDEIYESISVFNREQYFCGDWGKLKNKKIVLWSTTHPITGFLPDFLNVSQHVSFDKYANILFKYAYNHSDEMGIIFRPHPAFLKELINIAGWTLDDMNQLRRYCKESKNIILDEEADYYKSFAVSDAILTDTDCGIIMSAFPLLKPICVMFRSRRVKEFDSKLLKIYYKAKTRNELLSFMDMVKDGKDPMKLERERNLKDLVLHFDGENGTRIKQFVLEKYEEMRKQ